MTFVDVFFFNVDVDHVQTSGKINNKINNDGAHVGNEGNERADALAKQGPSLTLPHTPLPHNPNFLPTPIPLSHVKNITRGLSLKTWNLQWDNSPHYRQTKIFFPKVDTFASGHLLKLTRNDFGRAIRWLTGHCFLNRHNHLLYPHFVSEIKLLCKYTSI